MFMSQPIPFLHYSCWTLGWLKHWIIFYLLFLLTIHVPYGKALACRPLPDCPSICCQLLQSPAVFAFSLQTTYLQSHRESCVRMSPLIHQPSSQRTTKSVECQMGSATWVPFNLKSFFLDMPIETRRRHQSNNFQKFGSSKTSDLSLKKVSMMSSVFNTSTAHPWHQSVAYSTGWFCWSPGWIPYQRRKPQKFQILTTYAFRWCFLFQWPKVPSTIQLVLQHPGVRNDGFCFGSFFTINFHQPIYLSNISSNISPLPSFKTKKISLISRSRPVQVQWDSWNLPRQLAWRA